MRNTPYFHAHSRFGIVLMMILLVLGCTEKTVQEARKAQPPKVYVDEVKYRRVEIVLEQIGTLKAKQEVTIRTETIGLITKILFQEGSDVNKGDILIQLDAAKIDAQITNLNAQIAQLKIRLANKQKELERNQPLVKQNLVSSQQFDNLKTDIEETESEINQAEANLQLQRERLDDTVIRAPFDGVTAARTISLGDYLDTGDPVVQLVTLDPLEIQFQVLEKFIPNISLGQTVQISVDAYPEQTFQGTIIFISPNVDAFLRTVEVKAELRNQDRLLKPGMFARVSLVTEVHENAVTVPTESIIQTEDETYVYVLQDGSPQARKIIVSKGESNDSWTELLNVNIAEGTKVIVEGKYTVKDGSEVSVQVNSFDSSEQKGK